MGAISRTALRKRTAEPATGSFHNRGDGTFEDVTAKSGIFDSSSKSLGVAMLDYDLDGWPDLFVANDTQPNKLYRNNHVTARSRMLPSKPEVAFSDDGKARVGMGVDAADYENSGVPGIAVTNFDDEMIGLYPGQAEGILFGPRAAARKWAESRATASSALRASFSMSISTACSIFWW